MWCPFMWHEEMLRFSLASGAQLLDGGVLCSFTDIRASWHGHRLGSNIEGSFHLDGRAIVMRCVSDMR